MYYKYPRTFHAPWSLGRTKDDKVLPNMNHFVDSEVVVTEKLDGENYTLYRDHCHARSVDSGRHESRTWIKSFHSTIAHEIPDTFRICGENVYAMHSIYYTDLISYFYGFSIWEDENCLSWDDTIDYFSLLNITSVPVLYKGIYNGDIIKSLDVSGKEGYVIRKCNAFNYKDFQKNVAKFVRANHVQTDSHWMYSEITPNKLKS